MINFLKNKMREFYISIKNPLLVRGWKAKGMPNPPPQYIKKLLIDEVRRLSGYKVLIETGTYRGDMIKAQLNNFKKIYSIELSDFLFTEARNRFHKSKHVKVLQGDSGLLMPELLKQIDESAIFWLDGHYSGGITAQGELECPIYMELDAIFNGRIKSNAILIDDARCFVGLNDYPTIDEIIFHIENKVKNYHHCIINDVIIFLPKEITLPSQDYLRNIN